ncbi:hypothetical protein [Streptomyces sp. AC495_CC817]|uniref:hypothetical protein n=1 Tax=Streptomyces sp. AC495_CC817 TaxID=2823900 RepID=UPI001C265213|nr:hypothetical protein [Streptomyces sp. AC495_CC817]
MSRAGVASAVLGALLVASLASPAHADTGDDEDIAPQIVATMAEVPGGVIVDPNHAVWPGLGMEVVVPASAGLSARSAVGGCVSGRVCVFTGASASGAVLSWSTCGYHAIPGSFAARSIANARSAGTAHARAGTTALAVAAAGTWANISGSADNVMCYF